MSVSEKAARITVDLGDRALYRRLRIEAVTYWLDQQKAVEDELASRLIERRRAESPAEYVPHETGKRQVAEGRERR